MEDRKKKPSKENLIKDSIKATTRTSETNFNLYSVLLCHHLAVSLRVILSVFETVPYSVRGLLSALSVSLCFFPD